MSRSSDHEIPEIPEIQREKPSNPSECRVRVWLKHGENIGHASLATSTHYASQWPASSGSANKIMSYFEVRRQSQSSPPLDVDIGREGNREPDHMIRLFSLNIDLINQAIDALWEQSPGWALFGEAAQDGSSAVSTGFSWMSSTSSKIGWMIADLMLESAQEGNRTLKAQSCVSAVLLFLIAGGIESINPGYTKAMKKAVKTPEMLAHYLIVMRQLERKKSPETAQFDADDEVAPAKGCSLM